MANNENLKKAKGFDKMPENINRNGRPKRLISVINKELKDEGFAEANKVDIVSAYMTLINLPMSKVMEISKADNDHYPILYKLVAKEMLGKRGLDMLEKLLDRAIGRPQQYIEQSGEMLIIKGITFDPE